MVYGLRDVQSTLETALATAAKDLERLRADARALGEWTRVADRLAGCLKEGGKVLVFGNGGSHADAMHFAEECTGRFRNDRPSYAVLAPADAAHLTCVSNDFGFEQVFSRLVDALARPGDVVMLLSTSGRSPNLLRAAERARASGATVVGLVGREGEPLAGLCDLCVKFPGETSDRIQELQMLSLHALVEALEGALGGQG